MMPDEPPPLPRWPRWQVLWFGLLAASAFGGLLCGGLTLLGQWAASARFAGLVTLPSLFLLPWFIGLTAAFFWRKLELRSGETALWCLYLALLDLGGAAVFLREGIICLLIVSPLLYVLVLAGGISGRVWFRRDPSKLQISVLPLLALLVLAEPFTRAEQTGFVTDRMVIHAPPARVWPQITAFPAIPAPPRFWLFKLGLPYPVATTTAGNYVGADRRCIFSGNAVFRESVAGLTPERELTFDILEVPPDPELLGHLTPRRGQFLLHDNGDGTTTLTGTTWYTLHVRPLWYFDWWTHYIFQAVHLRVMEDVKRRAEA